MGTTKTETYAGELLHLSGLFKALGHPARLAILAYLLKQPGCICGDLVLNLPLSQSTVSQHLRELRQAGLIQGQIEGTSICYCLNPVVFAQLEQFLKAFSQPSQNTCC